MKLLRSTFFLFTLLAGFVIASNGQSTVAIADDVPHYILSFSEIEYLEDSAGTITLSELTSGKFDEMFKGSQAFNPENYNRNSYYWYRIKIHHSSATQKQWQLEFFDQTIDEIDFYYPGENGDYDEYRMGDRFAFRERILQHKNFLVHLPEYPDGDYTYYFRIKSRQQADVVDEIRRK